MKIIKRNGTEVDFESSKIVNAIKGANKEVVETKRLTEEEIVSIADYIENKAKESTHNFNVEEIQDMVEDEINKKGKFELGRRYSQYRFKRALIRKGNALDEKLLSIVNYDNEDVKQENSNKNPQVVSIQRDYIAGEVSRDITNRILLDDDIVEAHNQGIIHFHDSDYFMQRMHNCGLVNIKDMLEHGTVISDNLIETPKSFLVACNVITQIAAQVASVQFGGQSMSMSHIAPFVDVSRQKIKKKLLIDFNVDSYDELSDSNKEIFDKIVESRVRDEIKNGVQTIQYQVSTIMTTNGQAPFITFFMYIDEVPEGQTRDDLVLIIEEMLKQRMTGIKNEQGVYVTPAFPKLIYVLDEDNIHEDSKYYWLTELAAKCTARRLVPDYISAKKMKEIKGDVYTCMGCVEGSEVVTYKFRDKLYVEGFERMWDRLSFYFKPKTQKGRKYDYFMDLCGVSIYDKVEGFVNVKRLIRNLSTDWLNVKMSNGRSLVCTTDHPFHTINRGRVHAEDLQKDDEIIINKSQYSEETIEYDTELAYALGVFLCDGCYDRTATVSLAITGEDDIIERIEKPILDKFGTADSYMEVIERHRGKKGDYKDVKFRDVNPKLQNTLISLFGGLRKSERHIPNSVFSFNREAKLAFLAGMIDADGYINNYHSSAIIEIGSTNKELALQQMLLLQSVGIPSSMYYNHYDKKNKSKIRYRIEAAATEEIINALACNKKKEHGIDLNSETKVYSGEIGKIVDIEYLNEKVDFSYDVTTDSDHFDVSGIYSHNCRSFLTVEDNILNEDGNHKFYGRFNQGVVTINLVDVALSSGKDEEKFWDIMEERLELCHRALRKRHERLLGTPSDFAPIIWQHGGYARLKKGETIDKLLFDGYSTISLGYAGLYECVYYMKGASHTDERAKDFALSVMQKLNDKCKEWRNAENIAYSVYGTPIESTTYKFAKCLKNRFGVIEGVTDHNYITNSYHIPVTENINAFDKLTFESEFQLLSPGGAISYVEIPDMKTNIYAVLEVMKHIYNTIIYAELNTKSDYCQECGYEGEIKVLKDEESNKWIWRCPQCGNTDQNKMNVARRTCGYIGSNFWNQGRTEEIAERVLHLDNRDIK